MYAGASSALVESVENASFFHGQDGLGEAPIKSEDVAEWRKYLSGLNGDPPIEWRWNSFKEYIETLEASGTATNVASLVGHGNLRLYVLGMEDREPTLPELEEMKKLLKTSLIEGAIGLSTGLIYAPCVYSKTQELIDLCRVVSEYDRVFVVHMRDEGDMLLESIDEVLMIARESGVRVPDSEPTMADAMMFLSSWTLSG